jgi:hypothetical protein
VVVVVQPREVNREASILLDLSMIGHEDRPGLVLGGSKRVDALGDDSDVV